MVSQIGAIMEPTMNLSIKNVPEHIVRQLRGRAERAHRSLQGELLHIVSSAAVEVEIAPPARILADIRALGLATPTEAADIIRADRDGAHGR